MLSQVIFKDLLSCPSLLIYCRIKKKTCCVCCLEYISSTSLQDKPLLNTKTAHCGKVIKSSNSSQFLLMNHVLRKSCLQRGLYTVFHSPTRPSFPKARTRISSFMDFQCVAWHLQVVNEKRIIHIATGSHIAQVDFELYEAKPSASTSQVQGFQICATVPHFTASGN